MTNARANTADLGGALTDPLRDLPLLRTQIPPILLEALKTPPCSPIPTAAPRSAPRLLPSMTPWALMTIRRRPPPIPVLAKGNKAILDAAAGAA
jgi:hypothetical protein